MPDRTQQPSAEQIVEAFKAWAMADSNPESSWLIERKHARRVAEQYSVKVEHLRQCQAKYDELEARLEAYQRLEAACLAFQSDDFESWKAVIHALDGIREAKAREQFEEGCRAIAAFKEAGHDLLKPEDGMVRRG